MECTALRIQLIVYPCPVDTHFDNLVKNILDFWNMSEDDVLYAVINDNESDRTDSHS